MSLIKNLKQIKFDILTQREIKENAVVTVSETKINGENSVYDLRMGTQDHLKICLTCNEGIECPGHFGKIDLIIPVCHPLYLDQIKTYLSYFCQYCYSMIITRDEFKVKDLSRMNQESKDKELLKIQICPNKKCGELVPKYIIDRGDVDRIYYYYNDKRNKVEITSLEIENIFGKIKKDDIKFLGIKINPLDLILNYIPVLPPQSRPYTMMNDKICDDDLTYKLIEIVKVNNKLKEKLSEKKRKELIEFLNFHIKTMYDNHKKKAKQITNKRPIKSIRERLIGKGGRFRHDLSGKRVDFCGRTVFDIDPNLEIDQIGLPKEWEEDLTIPENVNDNNLEYWKEQTKNGNVNIIKRGNDTYNIRHLRKMVDDKKLLKWGDKVIRNGKIIDPVIYEMMKGKKFILKLEDRIKGTREILTGIDKGKYKIITIRVNKLLEYKSIDVRVGDICERKVKDNDYALFNRQPSLHKFSILANKIKFLNTKTIRLRTSLCAVLNADADGDELNIHIPQTLQAISEAKELISVRENLRGGRDSSTIISFCQDVITSGYLMTTPLKGNKNITSKIRSEYGNEFLKEFVIIDKPDFYNALCCIKNWDFTYIQTRMDDIRNEYSKYYKCSIEESDKYLFTGHGLFSMLLPNTLNIIFNNKIKKGEVPVVIKNGVMMSGSLDKSILGKKINSLPGILHSIYGTDITFNFVNNYELIADYIMICNGFSVGIKDCFSKEDKYDGNDPISVVVQKEVDKCFAEAKITYLTEKNPDILEKKINSILNKANSIGEKLSKNNLTENNALKSMILSGAKGNFVNPAQIIGLLGQRNVDGQRIPKHFKTRTLPHYKKNSIDMIDPLSDNFEDLDILFRSRGFIRSSYVKGLRPDEFFFDMGSGRVGILETAIKTSVVGYIARRLVKKMENYKISYNTQVINQSNNIISFDYNNGFDPSKTYLVNGKSSFTNVQILVDKLISEYEKEGKMGKY
jgi:DNA-directed RNA polymerase beta' subunit